MSIKKDYFQKLIYLAKSGNNAAQNLLFSLFLRDIIKAYEYGPEGIHSKLFGFNHNPSGKTFREESGEIFLWFLKAIQNYNPQKGMNFKNYLQQVIYFRSLDNLRFKKIRRQFEIFKDNHFLDSMPSKYSYDPEFSVFNTKQFQYVLSLFADGSDEHTFIKMYIQTVLHTAHPIASISKTTGRSRQSIYNCLKRIHSKVASVIYSPE